MTVTPEDISDGQAQAEYTNLSSAVSDLKDESGSGLRARMTVRDMTENTSCLQTCLN